MKPRVVLISQWPGVKNGEYELMERIKRCGGKVAIVDYLGFDLATGECLNTARMSEDYDFAISFHYDTPNLLNMPTYLWVANPLEFMYLSHEYVELVFPQLRSYAGYLYNGSDLLKAHIARLVGPEGRDDGLEMFPSCAVADVRPPELQRPTSGQGGKIFYCGVNWERGVDKAGRAHNLLTELQERGLAEFYGPRQLAGTKTWAGFDSYKGEIPFDGVSMLETMRCYAAVLAISSPAHLKSRTSSSRVFEAFAAGAPVISDRNPHVEALFGDLVHYFDGESDVEKAESIATALQAILNDPAAAERRVAAAQKLLVDRFCFDPCYQRALAFTQAQREPDPAAAPLTFDLFLFHHDLDPQADGAGQSFDNLDHVAAAAARAARGRNARVRILICADEPPAALAGPGVDVVAMTPADLGVASWDALRLGAKVARLAKLATGDLSAFLTQFDFPHHDYCTEAIDWFAAEPQTRLARARVGGYYVSDLQPGMTLTPAPQIRRVNRPVEMYRWSQESLLEHQFGSFVFGRGALGILDEAKIAFFDAVLPVAVFIHATVEGTAIERSRRITLRTRFCHFRRHYDALARDRERGFWRQHYVSLTNYNHENNALYDYAHASRAAVAIADAVTGRVGVAGVPFAPEELRLLNKVIRRRRRWRGRWDTFRAWVGLKRRRAKT